MSAEYMFPVLSLLSSTLFAIAAMCAKGVMRRILLIIAGVTFFLAVLSLFYGGPVRGPFADLTHPRDQNTFKFHAGGEIEYSLQKLSKGIDFSEIIHVPGNPIKLIVSRPWWSDWKYDIEIRSSLGTIKISNKEKNLPRGWDCNYDYYAIEIVDTKLNPVFQLFFDSEYDLYLNAAWEFENKAFIVRGDEYWHKFPKEYLATNRFPIIFRYPSKKYRGKRL